MAKRQGVIGWLLYDKCNERMVYMTTLVAVLPDKMRFVPLLAHRIDCGNVTKDAVRELWSRANWEVI